MGPSATEVELSLLAPHDAERSTELMVQFIDFLAYMFSTKRNVDLAVSYLGLFMKVCIFNTSYVSFTLKFLAGTYGFYSVWNSGKSWSSQDTLYMVAGEPGSI
jgi:hypothetical protein